MQQTYGVELSPFFYLIRNDYISLILIEELCLETYETGIKLYTISRNLVYT